jgi:co-chaperonin GroES (HSP10)
MEATNTTIKYERIIPIMDRILVKAINIVGDNNNAEQSKLREVAQKRILEQKIEEFEITKAMNSCGFVVAASVDAHWVSSGDLVFWGKYAGAEIMIESESHLMIHETDVLFILK